MRSAKTMPPFCVLVLLSCRTISSMLMSSFSSTSPRSRPRLFSMFFTSPERSPASIRFSIAFNTTTSGPERLAAAATAALYSASRVAAFGSFFSFAFINCALSLFSAVWSRALASLSVGTSLNSVPCGGRFGTSEVRDSFRCAWMPWLNLRSSYSSPLGFILPT